MRVDSWRGLLVLIIALSAGVLGGASIGRAASPTCPATKNVCSKPSGGGGAGHAFLNCVKTSWFCTDVAESDDALGTGSYVGHDEPSVLFYSGIPNSGNQMQWRLSLPSDPPPLPEAGRSFNFQLHPAFWFGMAMCDTQSYPLQVPSCTPDSDSNITDAAHHPGTAFMEMQFYPPGWVTWPAGSSCDAARWCAALNIDSLSEDPLAGKLLNDTCISQIGSPEYVNFAFITKSGVPQAPPNPVQATLATFTPNLQQDLLMNSGDAIIVTMHDTASGLEIDLRDSTTGQSGSMVTSAANGFGQVQFAPNPSTSCKNIPYDFHPMYSTSTPQTIVPWAVHTYNVAFADEIGHFDYCTAVSGFFGDCTGQEGTAPNLQPADADDLACFPASASTLVAVTGCQFTNFGFDGVPYQPLWPDGNTSLHPTPIAFTSPLTGGGYQTNYQQAAFEADLPALELTCDVTTGDGCTLLPITDSGTPAPFYPFFSTTRMQLPLRSSCVWEIGNDIPGETQQDFGKNAQYGTILASPHLLFGGGGAIQSFLLNFQQVLPVNPCPAVAGG